MINIFRVFLSDVKRLSSNVVAIVIIMGLSIIPALYAWFNIMSNWDPYGEDATSQMNIAVYSFFISCLGFVISARFVICHTNNRFIYYKVLFFDNKII